MATTVEASLRHSIAEGKLPPGRAVPSERALADEYGVSRTVVRQALNLLVRDGLIVAHDRCRPVVATSHFAKKRSSFKPRHIGIWLWPYAEDYVASSIFRGIQRATQGTGARLMIATACQGTWDETLDSEARFLHELAEDDQADGAILWYLGGARNRPVLEEVRKRGLRLVFIDRKPPTGIDADFVGTENVASARRATSYLISQGHRRIVFVGNLDPVSSVEERRTGFERAMQDAGIELDDDSFAVFEPRDGEPESFAAMRTVNRLMDRKQLPSAIFAVNDSVALHLVEAMIQKGIKVPEEMSVVGFDGLLRWLPGGGHLTSAVQDFARVGELAGELLFERLAGPSSPTYRHILLDAPLSVNETTAHASPDPGYTAGLKEILQ